MTRRQLKNTLKQAVALSYDGTTAPVVSAKGKGIIAEEIIRVAKENEVPIREEKAFVNMFSQVQLGAEIPEELYLAAAEVIAFAYLLKNKQPPEKQH